MGLAIFLAGEAQITSISSTGAVHTPRLSNAGAAFRALAATLALGVLIAPAIWNRYPLLEYDTGGYLARWYEGYLVPSRSTVYGLFLHLGERAAFWPEVILQAAAAVWVIALTLRIFGLERSRGRLVFLIAVLSATTTLGVLASELLTDIFAGLSVLALHLLVFHRPAPRPRERLGLFLLVAFSAATHEATMAVLIAVLAGAAIVSLARRGSPDVLKNLLRGAGAITLGAVMLVAANFALAREIAWTPGGYGIAFGRMLQDGIVARYLADHCPDPAIKLCPYRDTLPATADEFLWGDSPFDRLGRFAGLGDEMRKIVLESLLDYPIAQLKAALASTAKQLVMVGTGYGIHDDLAHTYGIIERYIPDQAHAMHAARQQQGELDSAFAPINRVHVPVALLSMAVITILIGRALAMARFDAVATLAASAMVAIVANAFICGVLSGPHDRYGARIAWLATFVAAIAFMRCADLSTRGRTNPI